MMQALGPAGPLLYGLILISLGLGLPVIVVLAIRFLYYRQIYLGRSRELDRLMWQLHRIATALEHEKGLSFPAEPPGMGRGEAGVVAQRPVAANPSAQAPTGAAPASGTAAQPGEQDRAGVNSMFGL